MNLFSILCEPEVYIDDYWIIYSVRIVFNSNLLSEALLRRVNLPNIRILVLIICLNIGWIFSLSTSTKTKDIWFNITITIIIAY